jgi:hypothetical protein
MTTATALVLLFVLGIGVFYKLVSTALRHRANVRAGARFGLGSFFLEVTDQKPEKPQLPEE